MSLHDDILTEISGAASSVRLVASLRDSRLNYGSPDTARIFLPDMHIVTNRTRAKYKYGTNDMDLLSDMLTRLANLKARSQGKSISAFQVGDFLDLWREEPVASARIDAASRIMLDHQRLMSALMSPTLKARFLLGNHDVDLAWWPNFTAWERRYFLPPERGSNVVSGIAIHGDAFDWVEMLPDALNHIFVYLFSPLAGPADHDLHTVRDIITRQNNRADFSSSIAGPAALGELAGATSVPARHNLSGHNFLDKAREAASVANASFGLNLRFMVIGHTHHARIALHDGGGDDFFALIDCGGWLEDAHDSTGATYPNQTLAVVAENEARVYLVHR